MAWLSRLNDMTFVNFIKFVLFLSTHAPLPHEAAASIITDRGKFSVSTPLLTLNLLGRNGTQVK